VLLPIVNIQHGESTINWKVSINPTPRRVFDLCPPPSIREGEEKKEGLAPLLDAPRGGGDITTG